MAEHSARITNVSNVGKSTIALTLKTDESIEALPGQFVLLQAEIDGEEETGYYTISSPTVDSSFEVTVGVDSESKFSTWLAERETGDTIQIKGPFGKIAYDDEGDVVTIAGGPGIGPAVAIAERATENNHSATVIYQDDTPAHKKRLNSLSDRGQTVRIFHHDEESLKTAIGEHRSSGTIYIFGFSDFCNKAKRILESVGGDPEGAHVESFG
ncbi:FAD-dependent oxidoreductase [Halobellus clavatus]|uniref:Ferredoxin-NADP reductase n=1 Tax=Halobellus clavatus TaxID=660517 RepID=A0A1H3KUH5_9EURY|nr:FAD-dependent oxidoreductase [Halobellus clavatus]SDY55629.1 Ferredoxin-NADP reductase [Halobellus clavatus]